MWYYKGGLIMQHQGYTERTDERREGSEKQGQGSITSEISAQTRVSRQWYVLTPPRRENEGRTG